MLTFLNMMGAFLQPPGLNIWLLFISIFYLLCGKRWLALFWLMCNIILLYILSIPLCTNQLINYLESPYKQINLDHLIKNNLPAAKAIVVLSAGPWPNANGIMRNLYTAKLANTTKLPVLVSGGGNYIANRDNEAAEMAKSLAIDFNVSGTIWVDGKSNNTIENAKFTKQILEKNNITEIFLVTNAWHMSRALQIFNIYDINVIPVPILSNIANEHVISINYFIPSVDNLTKSTIFFHEYFGMMWYKILHMFHID